MRVILSLGQAQASPQVMATETTSKISLYEPSLPEVHSSVQISLSPTFWKRLLGFLGHNLWGGLRLP